MTTPSSRPSSTTGSAPTSSVFISRAASCTVVSGVIAVGLEVIASCTVWCPMFVPFPRFERDTLGSDLKTVALLLLAVSLQPGSAAVGDEITVTGTPARAVVLEALETATRPVPLGVVGADGTLTAEVPDVPAGRYRVVVAGEAEAPVLEVVALSRDTSLLLLGFGFLLVLGLFVAGVVVPPPLARRDLLGLDDLDPDDVGEADVRDARREPPAARRGEADGGHVRGIGRARERAPVHASTRSGGASASIRSPEIDGFSHRGVVTHGSLFPIEPSAATRGRHAVRAIGREGRPQVTVPVPEHPRLVVRHGSRLDA